MSKHIGLGSRPNSTSQAEAWVHRDKASKASKPDPFRARLTIDITPALRARIKLAALNRGITMSEMLRELLEQKFSDCAP